MEKLFSGPFCFGTVVNTESATACMTGLLAVRNP